MRKLIIVIVAAATVSSAVSGTITGFVIKAAIDKSNTSQQRASAHKLFVAQVGGCQRNNIRTAELNRNALATWQEDTLFATALATPTRGESPAARRFIVRFHERLEATIATTVWTPQNHDCKRTPTSTQLPVTFATRQPPAADLVAPSAP